MKFVKTDFNHRVCEGSSWIVYITKTVEEASTIHNMAMTQMAMHSNANWYYSVSTNKVISDCRVPEFFHDHGYWMTAIEHNNGDWNLEQTYTLFVVE